MERIREAFGLNVEPWLDMDDDLIKLALSKNILNHQTNRKYGLINSEQLEWLGDSILGYMITVKLFDKIIIERKKKLYSYLSSFRNTLVRNSNLYCQMKQKNLCDFMHVKYRPIVKDCADVLESLIGALYYYLTYVKQEPAVVPIYNWYNKEFDIDNKINLLINNASLDYNVRFDKNLTLHQARNLCKSYRKTTKPQPRSTINLSKSPLILPVHTLEENVDLKPQSFDIYPEHIYQPSPEFEYIGERLLPDDIQNIDTPYENLPEIEDDLNLKKQSYELYPERPLPESPEFEYIGQGLLPNDIQSISPNQSPFNKKLNPRASPYIPNLSNK